MSETGLKIAIFFGSLLIAFLTAIILEKKFIPFLKSIKMGQTILEIGPRWHKSKEGTPTMGGLFIAAGLLVVLVVVGTYTSLKSKSTVLLFNAAMIFLYALVGFLDDYMKFVKKQNEGLKAWQKLILQFMVAAVYLYAMNSIGFLPTTLVLPFGAAPVDLGFAYYILAAVFITFIVNSVNLNDGIDGLCGSITLILCIFFALLAFCGYEMPDALSSLALYGGAAGGIIAFLYYNLNPARIFMGDTGSLMLGGLVAGAAFMTASPLVVAIAGLIYIIESVSVMLQVASFKLTGKRIFKMSPIHHHFEMCGWSENKIVRRFCLFTLIFCVAAYIIFYVL